MEHRVKLVFLFLIMAQAAHSTEEYVAKLYEVFTPARLISRLVSDDLALGFIVANVALIAFGLLCWAFPVRLGWKAAGAVAWFWALLEFGNGVGHVLMALTRKSYFPGVLTAPLLMLFAGWLLSRLKAARLGVVRQSVTEA